MGIILRAGGTATTEVLGDGRQVTGLAYQDRTTDEVHTLKLSGLFVQIGLVPNTTWLRDSGLELSRTGEIGRVTVLKLENKGRQNRRISIALED